MEASVRRTLRRLARRRSAEDMRLLFETIRALDDETLLAGAPAPRTDASRDFAAVIVARLQPVVAPAAEKAQLLVDAMERPEALSLDAVGLKPTIRKLAARFGEAAVAAAADRMLAAAERWGSSRERVT